MDPRDNFHVRKIQILEPGSIGVLIQITPCQRKVDRKVEMVWDDERNEWGAPPLARTNNGASTEKREIHLVMKGRAKGYVQTEGRQIKEWGSDMAKSHKKHVRVLGHKVAQQHANIVGIHRNEGANKIFRLIIRKDSGTHLRNRSESLPVRSQGSHGIPQHLPGILVARLSEQQRELET
ncbi:hypothetical protein FIBSPDRAFT_900795 [Athelia psychrophila]|uniref:Uncharacterized protein n=1 Tax=Athelia psychrophila TaxID=1759441 RepID=A0A165Y0J7_9AGAM|nr:hypothetical protein FIBSPDRAFT_900795 [Fibularhizoctonia sp. CBS 109695]